MKKHILLFVILCLTINVLAQKLSENFELGYYFDINHQKFDGYVDMEYDLKKHLNITYTIGQDYTPGCYYDKNKNKITGYLEYSQNNTFFRFKETKDSKPQTIKPDVCIGYKIGLDSFAVIKDFKVERMVGGIESNKNEFAEVIDRVNNLTFYKHTRVGHNNIVTTYLVKADTSDNYISFSKFQEKFNEAALIYFGCFDYLKQNIKKGKYCTIDIPELVKLLKYKSKFDSGEKIYFSASGDEVDQLEEMNYYAIIESITDSIFHLKYYSNQNVLSHEGDYTSFYPQKKKNVFTFYYPNGQIRKEVLFKNYEPFTTRVFYGNNKLHYEYRYKNGIPAYSKVRTIDGKEILDSLGNGTETFYDSITNHQITCEFANFKPVQSYYIDKQNRKIFLLCEKNAKLLTVAAVQNLANDRLEYPTNSVRQFNHGLALVKFIVEADGSVSEIKLLKGVDGECDSLITGFLKYATKDIWKPAKENKQKVIQEIILPVEFSLEGFSRYRNYYYYDPFFMNQMKFNTKPVYIPRTPPMPVYRF